MYTTTSYILAAIALQLAELLLFVRIINSAVKYGKVFTYYVCTYVCMYVYIERRSDELSDDQYDI